ncbi:MAG TPA: tetratricopeptide repeat protein [Pseudolabrys sp.]|nr:tetratricopeptide repeat protein [Pseudolabrys sp.]
MTASLISFKEMRTHDARPQPRLVRRVLAVFVVLEALLLIALTLGFAGSARAEDRIPGELSVFNDGGFIRLAFRFDQEIPASIRQGFPIMVVKFKKPIAVSVDRLSTDSRGLISVARLDPDGTAIRIALTQKVKVNTIPAAERYYVDLLPETWTGVMPGLPQDVIAELARRAQEAERQLHRQKTAEKDRKPPTIRVRVASQPTFIRYVFEVPDGVNVVPDQHDGKFVLTFDRQIKWDLADAVATLPPTLKSIEADIDYDQVAINFVLNGTPKVRSFHEDRGMVVDVGLDGAPAKQAAADPASAPAAAPEAAPTIAAPETVPVTPPPADKPADPPLIDQPPLPPAAPKQAEKPPLPEAPKAAPPAQAPTLAAAPLPPAKPAPAIETKPAVAAAPHAASPAAAKAAEAQPPAEPAAVPAAAPAAAPKAAETKAAETRPVEAKGPPPDPHAAVRAVLHKSGDGMRVEFPFAAPTPAAVFRRADMLWLVFDSEAPVDLTVLRRDAGDAIREAHFDRLDGAAVVRLRLKRPQLIGVLNDGPAWIVDVGDRVMAPTKQLAIARSIAGKNRASIAIPFDNPRKAHLLTDPAVGDRLMVVTALAPARGFLKGQNFVELRALPSAHGIVLQPLADDLSAELAADKLTVSRPLGLALSPTAIGQQQVAPSFRAMTFDTQLWGFDRNADFNRRQSDLIGEAAMAPPQKRRAARLNLARFYLARDMSAEALAVLDVTLADERGADDITGTVLKAIADVMLNRPDEALKALANPQVGNQLDAPLWRAVAYARLGKWAEAHDRFKDVDAALGALPIELQRMGLRYALRAAIEVRDFARADKVLNELQTIGVPDEDAPAVAVLVGRMAESMGRNEDALTNYRAAAASADRRSAAAGRLHEVMLRFALGDMPRKEVVDQLETLTTIWRGDETEVEGLKLLAHLYTEDGRYREAFHVMRTAMLAHPDSDLTRKIQDEAAVSFEALFLGGKSDALPPVEALGLFYDYRELTPIGRRGDEMIRKLADRLVAVDLLDQAAELLQHQIDNRLQGAARAQVATRLATIYLTNRKPDRALATLRATRTEGLAKELREQRLLLEARALSETGRHDLALEIVGSIEGRQAVRLRADILWAARKWREAAEQIELLYGERWKEFTPLSDAERVDILRAAIGYSLGDEPLGLGRLREKYTAKMAETPDRHAFEVVSAPTGGEGKEFKDVARAVSGVDTLDAFLRDMRARYPDTGAVTDGEGKAQPAPAGNTPAPDKAASARPAAKPETKSEAKSETKSEAKPETKSETKSEPKPGNKSSALPPSHKADPAPTGSIPSPSGPIVRSAGPRPAYR